MPEYPEIPDKSFRLSDVAAVVAGRRRSLTFLARCDFKENRSHD